MKKTIITSAMAICLSTFFVNAKTYQANFESFEISAPELKVNSFCAAIAKGDLETVKKLIELGEDVNRRSNGMTPLMYAAKYNRVDIAKLLVAEGAKTKTRSNQGHTALNYAEMSKATDVIQYLEGLS